MKKHFNNIITKLLFIAPVIGLIGSIFNIMDFKAALLTAAIITLGSYLSADLVLLPQVGNIAALVGDAIISFIVFWEMSTVISGAHVNFIGISLAAAVIIFGEWYFHRYLKNTHFFRQQGQRQNIVTAKNISIRKNNQQKKKKKN